MTIYLGSYGGIKDVSHLKHAKQTQNLHGNHDSMITLSETKNHLTK